MIRIFTVSIRETIRANPEGEKTGEQSRQVTVRATDLSSAVEKTQKKLDKQHGDLAVNHEIVAVTLTHEIPDEEEE